MSHSPLLLLFWALGQSFSAAHHVAQCVYRAHSLSLQSLQAGEKPHRADSYAIGADKAQWTGHGLTQPSLH